MLAFCTGLCVLGAASPQSHTLPTYLLRDGEQVIAAGSDASAQFAAQDIIIQLAVVGSIRHPETFVSDVGTLYARVRYPISSAQLNSAVSSLIRAGISQSAIHASIIAPSSSTLGIEMPSVGRILVRMPSAAIPVVRSQIRAAQATSPNIIPVNYVAAMQTCDDQDRVAQSALRRAVAEAGALGHGIGLETMTTPSVSAITRGGGDAATESICGSESPAMRYTGQLDLESEILPKYSTSASGSVVLRVTASNTLRAQEAPWLESSDSPPSATTIRSSGISIVIPPEEQFVSARGVFRAIVRDDGVLLEASTYPTASPAAVAALRRRLLSAAIPHSETALHENRLVALLPGATDSTISKARKALEGAQLPAGLRSIHYSAVPLFYNCNALDIATARAALHSAHDRAVSMASAAGATVGAFLALNDLWRYRDGVCVSRRDGIDRILEAAASYSPLDLDLPNESASNVQVAHAVAAAWRLNGLNTSAPRTLPQAQPTPYRTIRVPFDTIGRGVVGRQTKDVGMQSRFNKCHTDAIAALHQAVSNGLRETRGSVRALMDGGDIFADNGRCALGDGRYPTDKGVWGEFGLSAFASASADQATVTESVLVIP